MAALKGFARSHRNTLKSLKLRVGQDLGLKSNSSVLLLFSGPFTVLLVEGSPVVIDVLVDFHITDLEAWEAIEHPTQQIVSEVPDKIQEDEANKHRPLNTAPTTSTED